METQCQAVNLHVKAQRKNSLLSTGHDCGLYTLHGYAVSNSESACKNIQRAISWCWPRSHTVCLHRDSFTRTGPLHVYPSLQDHVGPFLTHSLTHSHTHYLSLSLSLSLSLNWNMHAFSHIVLDHLSLTHNKLTYFCISARCTRSHLSLTHNKLTYFCITARCTRSPRRMGRTITGVPWVCRKVFYWNGQTQGT